MRSLCQALLPIVAVEIERLFSWFDPSRSYLSRQHYRIVFKEVGEAVSNVKNRKYTFLAIRGVFNGEYKFLFLQA